MQDAWTQAFMQSGRRRETLSKRAVAWWEVETSRSKPALLEVTLLVIFGLDNFCCKLGAFCYILMGLFGCACPYVHELKILVN